MDRSVPSDKKSSLLFQLPKSVLSLSDSGNSFLIPVAVDDVVATESPIPSTSTVTEAAPVCQLQQPLLMHRGSPGPKTTVPYSETADVESVQAGVSYSGLSLEPSVSDSGISSQPVKAQNWQPSMPVPSQSSSVFAGFQNPPPTLQSESVSQQHSFPSTSFNQENMDTGQQRVYPHEPVVDRSFMSAFPSISSQQSEFLNATAPAVYSSQPPAINPSGPSMYQNDIAKEAPTLPQTPFLNPSNPNFMAQNSNGRTPENYSRVYSPVEPYWLFLDIVETKEVWCGFSELDSSNLEIAFQQDHHAVVAVDGGRYDALLSERIKRPVYFEAKDLQISRGTWFYRRCSAQRYIPFPEVASDMLEQHYAGCVTSGHWQKRVNVPGIGTVVMEGPEILLYYRNDVEMWPTLPDSKTYPQPVRRGIPDNFDILEDQNNQIDHLVFIVQGIGSFCDLRFRTVAECVDGFREIANKLTEIHFKPEVESGRVGRVEFLPLAWHAKLHTSDKGFDRCMKNITLPSIPKLRHFTNDTLLDILLYSSPTYCQTIIDTVASELNKLYEIFLRRNPGFSGSVFVAGHSLGSLILFDILANQNPPGESNETTMDVQSVVQTKVPCQKNILEKYESMESFLQTCQLEEYRELFEKEKIDLSALSLLSENDLEDLGLPKGPRKKLLNAIDSDNQKSSVGSEDLPSSSTSGISFSQNEATSEVKIDSTCDSSNCFGFPLKTSPCMSSIKYPKLHFEPACFFALGSPISMFLTVRGYEFISEDFKFPTCQGFFHIFHPYDPVAFRIEPLIEPTFSAKPVLIPHHKGRKRMHLEIRESLSKVGTEIKQKVLETLKYTWDSLSVFAKSHSFTAAVEAEVDRLMEQEITDSEYSTHAPSETLGEDIQIGSLNGGRRIDYVLQEKPIEALNDYIFALTSHATYWDSEDTVLMILREIYATRGIVSSPPVDVTYSPTEKTLRENFSKLSTVMSDPSLYQSSHADVQSTKVSAYFDPDLGNPPTGRAKRASVDSVNAYREATLNQVPSATFASPFMAAQPVGPLPTSVTCPVGPHPTSVSHPVRPPPVASTSQPVGPPPLTGFVKRSPFAR